MAGFEAQDVAELFGEHGGLLLSAARGVVRSEADAEDAVQDAMLAILSAPHLLAVIENLGGWLYTTVRRRCVDLLRREGVRQDEGAQAAIATLFDADVDIDEELDRQDLAAAVADSVRRLDEPLRQAFVQNVLEGKTFKEMSADGGVPMGTLMARKARAVELVRGELRMRGVGPSDAQAEEEK